jgi:F420-dependent oxidoreductase-like protein
MHLEVFTEPEQGSTYESLRAFARRAEDLGFDGFFCADHYGTSGRLPGPVDAWTTLAGLACETTRVRLGTLVSPVTFRGPGPLAVAVAQIDSMSGGRVELGLGAGHMDGEHRAYGIPFPPLAERFDRLEEQLEAIVGLWTTPPGDRYSFHGRHYTFVDSPALPKPHQIPHPPIIIGGRGLRRTPRLAAAFASELNVSYVPPTAAAERFERARDACERLGRDPATLRCSTTMLLCCGERPYDVRRRAAVLGDRLQDHASDRASKDVGYWGRYPALEAVAPIAAFGTPQEIIDRLEAFRAVGTERVYLHCLDLEDHEQLDLVAREILPFVTT